MKIGLTADLHLRTFEETPERYRALQTILDELKKRQIDTLFVAGDTFDKEFYDYKDFNEMCIKHKDLRLILIPGNHDPEIKKRFFYADNIEIIDSPTTIQIGNIYAVVIPYISSKTIDEILSELMNTTGIPEKYILIGHGSYQSHVFLRNSYEPGFYMPVSSAAILRYKPVKVFLGHIHKPLEAGIVYYPGSPCGLDITETGKRRFIVYSSEKDKVENVYIITDVIFFNESILVFPFEDEYGEVERQLNTIIEEWKLHEKELKYVKLILNVNGLTYDLNALASFIKTYLSKRGIITDLHFNVKVLKDYDEESVILFKRVNQRLKIICSSTGVKFKSSYDRIIRKAMEIIFLE